VRLDQLEIVRSPLSAPVDHARMAVLSFFAEVLDEALPEHDPQETVFPAAAGGAGADHGGAAVDAADLFFAVDDAADGPAAGYWPLHGLRRSAGGRRNQFQHAGRRAVLRVHRNGNASSLSADSWQLAQRMLRAPASAFAGEPWPRRRAQDLRRFHVAGAGAAPGAQAAHGGGAGR
jgi:DNA repair protein RecO (recombination protein O)